MPTFNPFSITVGTTPTVLGNATITCDHGFLIVAAAGNSGTLHYGFANTITPGTVAATDGVELAAGASAFIPKKKAANAGAIWLVGSAAGQKGFVDPQ